MRFSGRADLKDLQGGPQPARFLCASTNPVEGASYRREDPADILSGSNRVSRNGQIPEQFSSSISRLLSESASTREPRLLSPLASISPRVLVTRSRTACTSPIKASIPNTGACRGTRSACDLVSSSLNRFNVADESCSVLRRKRDCMMNSFSAFWRSVKALAVRIGFHLRQ